MTGNIWIIVGLLAGAFSLFAIPYGFSLKSDDDKNGTSIETNYKIENTVGDIISGDKVTNIITPEIERGTWGLNVVVKLDGKDSLIDSKVTESDYILYPKHVNLSFTFEFSLKGIKKGSNISFGGLPFVAKDNFVEVIKLSQTGLNNSKSLGFTIAPVATILRLVSLNDNNKTDLYVTDGTENNVTIWGEINYRKLD